MIVYRIIFIKSSKLLIIIYIDEQQQPAFRFLTYLITGLPALLFLRLRGPSRRNAFRRSTYPSYPTFAIARIPCSQLYIYIYIYICDPTYVYIYIFKAGRRPSHVASQSSSCANSRSPRTCGTTLSGTCHSSRRGRGAPCGRVCNASPQD